MPTDLLLVLILATLLGVLLVLLGRRGRRINDHPQCLWCGFDLNGIYPEQNTCPECGAGLKRKHPPAVGNGVRRRMRWMIWSGVVLAVVPIVPLVAAGWAMMTGANVAKHLPVTLLTVQAKYAKPAQSDMAVAEMVDRLLIGGLSKVESDTIREFALARQSDRNASWSKAWSDLLERLSLSGLLTPEDDAKINRNSFRLVAEARPEVGQGEFLTMEIRAEDVRLPSNRGLQVSANVKGWTVGTERLAESKKLQDIQNASMNFINFRLSGPTNANGGRNWWSGMNETKAYISRKLPENIAPRDYDVRVRVDTQITDMSATRAVGGRMSRPRPIEQTLSSRVRVLGQGQGSVARIETKPGEFAEIREALTVTGVQVLVSDQYSMRGRVEPKFANISMLLSGPSFDESGMIMAERIRDLECAYEVTIELDGKAHRQLSFISGKRGVMSPPEASTPWATWNRWSMTSRADSLLKVPEAKKAKVTFKPRPELAQQSIDQRGYRADEWVFEDVPVVVSDTRSVKTVPLSKVTQQSTTSFAARGIMQMIGEGLGTKLGSGGEPEEEKEQNESQP